MRFLQTLQKNIKLLFRSKETAFTIIFGPLLIILLVGFAFSGQQEIDISVGIHSENYTALTDNIIETLKGDYAVDVWSSQDECLDQLKVGRNHLCIIFPPDFEVRDQHTNLVTFYVDPSRINLVYQVIEQLNTKFDFEREQLSMGLTGDILTNVNHTKGLLKQQGQELIVLQEQRNSIAQRLASTQGKMQAGEVNFTVMDLRLLRGQATSIENDVQVLYTRGIEELDEAIDILHDLEGECDDCANETKNTIDAAIDGFQEARTLYESVYEESPDKLQNIYQMIDDASRRISSIEEDYGSLQADAQFVQGQIQTSIVLLDAMKSSLTRVKGNIDFAHDLLAGAATADSESVVSPIRTQIQEVTGESSNLSFTYPYVLMLVIMFMGLMLGSTLIVTDKNSRAAFRNFTTATRDEFHIFMSFITTLLILLAQVLVILLFSYFLVTTPLLNNFGTTLVILLLAITLFSFFGMMLGYLARSQEAAMIASLAIGSVMLFVSNLVIPTEGMKSVVRAIAAINPYVILSELLKKSMLFGVPISEFGSKLVIVFTIAILFLIIIVGIQQYVRKRYFQQQATVEVKREAKIIKPLDLGGRIVKDEYDLLTVLDLMNRQQFAEVVNDKENPIHGWMLHEIGNKRLANKMKTTSKERMILVLDRHLKKITKKHSKR